jgi:hypothetical protein
MAEQRFNVRGELAQAKTEGLIQKLLHTCSNKLVRLSLDTATDSVSMQSLMSM